MDELKHKVCKKCDAYLLCSEFYKKKAVCKKCLGVVMKEKYNKNREKYISYNIERYKTKKLLDKVIKENNELENKIKVLENTINLQI